jgi:phosphate transport system permease protein
MSSETPTLGTAHAIEPPTSPSRGGRRHGRRPGNSLFAHGEPMIWLTGGALVIALAMIAGLLGLIVYQGGGTFWPQPLVLVTLMTEDSYLGEVTREERYVPDESVLEEWPEESLPQIREQLAADGGTVHRRLFRTGNFELTGTHFNWIDDPLVITEERPEWALVVERYSDGTAAGRFYGILTGFETDGTLEADTPEAAWELFRGQHAAAHARRLESDGLKTHELGVLSAQEERARLAMIAAGQRHGSDSPQYAAARAEYERQQVESARGMEEIKARIAALDAENDRRRLVLRTADDEEARIRLSDVVRAYPANRLTWTDKAGVYLSRWVEFLTDNPREANSEGGVFPAIFGTVCMTLLMTVLVVPFGVLAALYLREYARAGLAVSGVRIAINNLAGVPSIVFGVFGLGFFCYYLGYRIDLLFFSAKLPNPTFGTGGLMWASLTLALLTLPVVIVATEEALSAVPNSMREGSYACGASKWQTIRRIVLPRALPGIMTGMILAMARGAGEVAPLMLVGAVKIAPDLVVDRVFPYVHPERSFMHLGFHIYDVGLQSQNSEAAKPLVFTTTLLLITIIALLNLTAVWLRGRLRRRFLVSQF